VGSDDVVRGRPAVNDPDDVQAGLTDDPSGRMPKRPAHPFRLGVDERPGAGVAGGSGQKCTLNTEATTSSLVRRVATFVHLRGLAAIRPLHVRREFPAQTVRAIA
jgi:hypothetical protein